jgi:hypothetical protein
MHVVFEKAHSGSNRSRRTSESSLLICSKVQKVLGLSIVLQPSDLIEQTSQGSLGEGTDYTRRQVEEASSSLKLT